MYLPALYEKLDVIFEVGAHAGDAALIEYCQQTGAQLYMFEPQPSRFQELVQKTKDVPSIHVFPLAISDVNGRASFNIADFDECSSLLPFDERVNETWARDFPIDHFEMVDTIEVDVMRLDTFMEQHQISRVDFIEIDAQGQDLKVVHSLGDKIRQVRRIQVEVNLFSAPLYQNACRKEDVMAYFAAHDFEKHLSWKQAMNREENIIFRNRRFYPNLLYKLCLSTLEQRIPKGRSRSARLSRRFSVMLFQKIFGHGVV